jgi:threonine aldolase
LYQVRKQVSPADLLTSMSSYCDELGVSTMDVYGDGGVGVTAQSSWLRRFECEVAETLGMSKGLFLPSGTMGQQIALCIHGQKQNQSPKSLAAQSDKKRDLYFICHHSSHLLLHEFHSYDALLGMHAVVIPSEQDSGVQGPVTYDSFMAAVQQVPTAQSAALCCVILECPHREIGGKCTPLEDVVSISRYCRSNGVKVRSFSKNRCLTCVCTCVINR